MLLHPLPKHSITVFLEAAAAANFPNSVNQHRLKRPGLSQRASQVKDMETSLRWHFTAFDKEMVKLKTKQILSVRWSLFQLCGLEGRFHPGPPDKLPSA